MDCLLNKNAMNDLNEKATGMIILERTRSAFNLALLIVDWFTPKYVDPAQSTTNLNNNNNNDNIDNCHSAGNETKHSPLGCVSWSTRLRLKQLKAAYKQRICQYLLSTDS